MLPTCCQHVANMLPTCSRDKTIWINLVTTEQRSTFSNLFQSILLVLSLPHLPRTCHALAIVSKPCASSFPLLHSIDSQNCCKCRWPRPGIESHPLPIEEWLASHWSSGSSGSACCWKPGPNGTLTHQTNPNREPKQHQTRHSVQSVRLMLASESLGKKSVALGVLATNEQHPSDEHCFGLRGLQQLWSKNHQNHSKPSKTTCFWHKWTLVQQKL